MTEANATTVETTEDQDKYLEYALSDWRDAVIIKTIAAVIENQWQGLIKGQGQGTIRNNKHTSGYIQALRDVHTMLINILPEDTFDENLDDVLPDIAKENIDDTEEATNV